MLTVWKLILIVYGIDFRKCSSCMIFEPLFESCSVLSFGPMKQFHLSWVLRGQPDWAGYPFFLNSYTVHDHLKFHYTTFRAASGSIYLHFSRMFGGEGEMRAVLLSWSLQVKHRTFNCLIPPDLQQLVILSACFCCHLWGLWAFSLTTACAVAESAHEIIENKANCFSIIHQKKLLEPRW